MIGARCWYVYCTDLQLLHDLFLSTVQMLTDRFEPLTFISLGPHDRAYVTTW